jgi:hypothetical protein
LKGRVWRISAAWTGSSADLRQALTFFAGFWVKPKIGAKERGEAFSVFMSHFLTRQKTRRKKTTRLSALRRAFPFGRGMNRNSPARRAQTTIHSDRVLASPPDAPDRARPGRTARDSLSRLTADLRTYRRTNASPNEPPYLQTFTHSNSIPAAPGRGASTAKDE